jgi:hypothetical protein
MSDVIAEVKLAENTLQQNVENQPVQQLSQQSQVSSAEPETEKEINWKKFKEARQKERDEALKMAERAREKEAETEALKAALAAVVNKPYNYQNNNQNDDQEESEDQRIDRIVADRMAKRETEALKQRQEQELASYPQRLKQTHSDFDQVCSAGNLDYLEYHHPELAKSLGSQQQSFEKWNDIYNAIKRYVPNMDTRKDQAKAQNNLAKPQSLSTPGVTSGGNAMPAARLDEQRKADNWARMQKAIKGIS